MKDYGKGYLNFRGIGEISVAEWAYGCYGPFMDWIDRGIVLTARKHGETSLIVSLLTEFHGRHAGLVRGGAGRRNRGLYQPGNLVSARWRGRLAEHLGTYSCEILDAGAASLLNRPLELAALQSAAALTELSLPDRENHHNIFNGLSILFKTLQEVETWLVVYVKWELGLLKELGFELDLSQCAATGTTEDLAYVSPKTGRAISRLAGDPYRNVALTLPPFLVDPDATSDPTDIYNALRLTGYFLERHVFGEVGAPPARQRLISRIRGTV